MMITKKWRALINLMPKKVPIIKTIQIYNFRFYVNCWGEIKISFQFITLFGFHSGGIFSLSAGGFLSSYDSLLAGSTLILYFHRFSTITTLYLLYCPSFANYLFS